MDTDPLCAMKRSVLNAINALIAHMRPVDAYMPLSVAADVRFSEAVDMPNYMAVTMAPANVLGFSLILK